MEISIYMEESIYACFTLLERCKPYAACNGALARLGSIWPRIKSSPVHSSEYAISTLNPIPCSLVLLSTSKRGV